MTAPVCDNSAKLCNVVFERDALDCENLINSQSADVEGVVLPDVDCRVGSPDADVVSGLAVGGVSPIAAVSNCAGVDHNNANVSLPSSVVAAREGVVNCTVNVRGVGERLEKDFDVISILSPNAVPFFPPKLPSDCVEVLPKSSVGELVPGVFSSGSKYGCDSSALDIRNHLNWLDSSEGDPESEFSDGADLALPDFCGGSDPGCDFTLVNVRPTSYVGTRVPIGLDDLTIVSDDSVQKSLQRTFQKSTVFNALIGLDDLTIVPADPGEKSLFPAATAKERGLTKGQKDCYLAMTVGRTVVGNVGRKDRSWQETRETVA
ncbi:hypothetical protein MA16_Dca001196 [Dendrobium catenatum]|uniref:Uncharacterized protein n=1 Tax=Dendrobium catenatum TaxID=906689 RepID=A0A2I0WLQ8_9ASPA|nr:hypothetical protein MA16_Dca001196 [Dendrobium catenatum]